jgi:NodT family efflux transporter outer membrane factor (OMF) lipoprotein
MALTMRFDLVLLLSGAIVAGCAVGPEFAKPSPLEVERYTREPLPESTASAAAPGGEAQSFLRDRDLPAEWWRLFESPALDALVREAIRANPALEGAQAALRQAHEVAEAQRGAFLPTVQASYDANRQRVSQALSSPINSNESIFTLHTAQISVGYALDVFGLNRRQVESLDAQAASQRFQLEATYVTLTSNVVAAAIQEAGLRAQLTAAREIVAVNTRSLELLRQQLAVGYAAGLDVAAQESALAQAEQALPPLEKQIEQTHNQIAALAGRPPALSGDVHYTLDDLRLPREIPVSLPSQLVAQRPDVRAAEENLHSASAAIGVATASMLPQFTITAAAGGSSTRVHEMFASGNPFWSIAGNIAQTLFDGGSLLHRKYAAEAAHDQALAQYRATVIAAFQDVANALQALQSDADALRAAARSEAAADRTLDLVTRQLRVGQVNYLALLSAEQAYQQSVLGLAQARAARLSDTAALFQALGGGWWNRAGNEISP